MTLGEPLEETAPAFLAALDGATYLAARRAVLEAPRHLFYDVHDTSDLLAFLDTLADGERRSTAGPPAATASTTAAAAEFARGNAK